VSEQRLYDLPEGWKWVRLEEICSKIQYGYTTKARDEGEIKLLRITDIQDNSVEWSTVPYCDISDLEYNKYFLKDDDIVIARTGATTGKSYLVKNPPESVFASYLIRISLKNNDPTFVWLFMQSTFYWDQISENLSGIAQPGVNATKLGELFIPIPPYPIQKYLRDKIQYLFSRLNQAKELIEEVNESFEKRRMAILHKAFTGELTKGWRKENWAKIKNNNLFDIDVEESKGTKELPEGWKWEKLINICSFNPPKYKVELPDDELCSFVPMRAVSDIYGEISDMEEEKYGKLKKGFTSFINGDVLFAKITPCMENGKIAIAVGLKEGFGFGSTEFHVLRVEEKILFNKYLYYYLRNKTFRDEASKHMTGTVGQRRVPRQYLQDHLLPLPSLKEQYEIVRILKSLLSKEEEAKILLELEEDITLLEKSILSKAFRGELSPNQPEEEKTEDFRQEILYQRSDIKDPAISKASEESINYRPSGQQ